MCPYCPALVDAISEGNGTSGCGLLSSLPVIASREKVQEIGKLVFRYMPDSRLGQ